mgnify:CR=1 FL=1
MIAECLFGGKRTLENPSTSLSNPDDWLYDALGSSKTSAGIRINSRTCLRYSAFWRGVNLIAASVAKIPCFVYKRIENGKEQDRTHFAHKLIWRKPNLEMTADVYRKTLMGHVLIRGNHYSYIFRRGDGTPTELIPLDPERTWPVRENGNLLYVTEIRRGLDTESIVEKRKLLPENVLHVKGLGYDGLMGYDVLEFARNSLGLGMAAEDFGARYFRNNAEPSVVIETPKSLSPKARAEFKQDWNAMHQGLENSHKLALLQEGATIKPFSLNARQSQLIETREFELKAIANWLGIPVHKVGHDARTSYNSIEQENQAFLDESIDPWLYTIECEFYDKLLTEQQKDDEEYTIEFQRNAFVRADIVARFQAYQTAIQYGIMNRNEVRAKENLNPVEGGDEFILPANIFGAKSGQEPPEGDEPTNGEATEEYNGRSLKRKESERRLLINTISRMTKRLALHARKAAKKPDKFDEWLEDFETSHRPVVREAIAEATDIVFWNNPHTQTDAITNRVFAAMRTDLDGIYSTQPEKEFPVAVDECMKRYENEKPEVFADEFLSSTISTST